MRDEDQDRVEADYCQHIEQYNSEPPKDRQAGKAAMSGDQHQSRGRSRRFDDRAHDGTDRPPPACGLVFCCNAHGIMFVAAGY